MALINNPALKFEGKKELTPRQFGSVPYGVQDVVMSYLTKAKAASQLALMLILLEQAEQGFKVNSKWIYKRTGLNPQGYNKARSALVKRGWIRIDNDDTIVLMYDEILALKPELDRKKEETWEAKYAAQNVSTTDTFENVAMMETFEEEENVSLTETFNDTNISFMETFEKEQKQNVSIRETFENLNVSTTDTFIYENVSTTENIINNINTNKTATNKGAAVEGPIIVEMGDFGKKKKEEPKRPEDFPIALEPQAVDYSDWKEKGLF